MKRVLVLMVGVSAGIASGKIGKIGGIGEIGLAHCQPRSIDDEAGTGAEPSQHPAASGPATAPKPETSTNVGGGDAEPAPAFPPPPPGSGEPPGVSRRERRHHRIAVMPRFAYRMGDAGRAVTPAAGFGIGGTIEIGYLRWAVGADPGGIFDATAALGLDFSHDRFATDEVGAITVDGMAQTFGATRVISETSFVLVHTLAAELDRVRPYFTLGAGMGLGYFDSVARDLKPGTSKGAHLLGRAAIGVDVKITRVWSLCVRADYTAVRRTSPLETDDGRRLLLFGDLLDMGAGIVYRF